MEVWMELFISLNAKMFPLEMCEMIIEVISKLYY